MRSFLSFYKNIFAVIIGVVFLLITPLSVAKIDDNSNVLRVGIDLTYAPFAYLENNQAEGFDPDFMRLLAQKSHKIAEFNDTRIENIIIGLESGIMML